MAPPITPEPNMTAIGLGLRLLGLIRLYIDTNQPELDGESSSGCFILLVYLPFYGQLIDTSVSLRYDMLHSRYIHLAGLFTAVSYVSIFCIFRSDEFSTQGNIFFKSFTLYQQGICTLNCFFSTCRVNEREGHTPFHN